MTPTAFRSCWATTYGRCRNPHGTRIVSVDGRANRASAVTDTTQSHLPGGHNNGYHADPPPPLDALSSSGGSGEVQTTTVYGLRFIKKDGWVFVSGEPVSSTRKTLGSAFRPPSTVDIPYLGAYTGDHTISINSDGLISAPTGSGIIQPTIYPARQA